jgi:ergothioneine biosynthesis protein EgtB
LRRNLPPENERIAVDAKVNPIRWDELGQRFRDVRAATLALAVPLSPEDCSVQSMDDASPVKWHLAHTTWFFETFVLERAAPSHAPFHPLYRYLFNSYYNEVGQQFPRPRRGMLSRPSLAEVLSYRACVDERVGKLLERPPPTTDWLGSVLEVGLHHEQQHQELILTDVKHMLGQNPLRPPYRTDLASPSASGAPPLRWLDFGAGMRFIGHDGGGFAFDNEGPRHRRYVAGFELASRLVTVGEYLEFMRDAGYRRPELWLSDGWAWVEAEAIRAPLYWESREDRWYEFTLGGEREVRQDEPVTHVSYYEADAFATWWGARLPAEDEWECAATGIECDGNFIEDEMLHPAPAPAAEGLLQLFGDAWEWTASDYAPYPGYRPPAGALGEYNGKFMCNQRVLRGGSCATSRSHVRASYRNFFPPGARWQFSGIRLAKSPDQP